MRIPIQALSRLLLAACLALAAGCSEWLPDLNPLPPSGDPRTPDIIVSPNVGVTYSGSGKKLAEHGGFSRDDTNVMMLLSNPSFKGKVVTTPVETMQVAPTILKALGLDPSLLEAVRLEGTQVLPGLDFGK